MAWSVAMRARNTHATSRSAALVSISAAVVTASAPIWARSLRGSHRMAFTELERLRSAGLDHLFRAPPCLGPADLFSTQPPNRPDRDAERAYALPVQLEALS